MLSSSGRIGIGFRDIYLLDDPLSAVDPQVGQHIFERCIRNELRGKTVLFVTHQLQFLSRCGQVIFMERGRIVDQGDHGSLMKRCAQYSSLIQTFNHDAEADADGDADGPPTGDLCGANVDDGTSSEDEMFSIASVQVFYVTISIKLEFNLLIGRTTLSKRRNRSRNGRAAASNRRRVA